MHVTTAVRSEGQRESICCAASRPCAIVLRGTCSAPSPSSRGASTSLQKHVSTSGSSASAWGSIAARAVRQVRAG